MLLVDSDIHSLQATAGMLANRDRLRIIDSARSGYEAVAKATICQPRLVLMEMAMESPQAGLLALREMRGALADCRIVFYTAVQDPEIVCKAYALGAANYLFKPAGQAALVRAVTAAGSGRQAISGDTGGILLQDYQRLAHLHEQLSWLIKIAMTLTGTELTILHLLCSGMQPVEIERVRFIEHSTMKTHLSHIMKKFDMDNIAQVVTTLKALQFFRFLDE